MTPEQAGSSDRPGSGFGHLNLPFGFRSNPEQGRSILVLFAGGESIVVVKPSSEKKNTEHENRTSHVMHHTQCRQDWLQGKWTPFVNYGLRFPETPGVS